MTNNSSNVSISSDSGLYEVCSPNISWNFLITFVCFAIVCIICQIGLIVVTIQEKLRRVSLPQILFLTFHFVFLIFYSLSLSLQQSGQCGWITLGNVTCKLLTWIRQYSYTTCNCLLLFPWDRQYRSFGGHKIFSFRVYIVSAIIIFGIVTVPYAVFPTRTTTQVEVNVESVIKTTYCELSDGHDIIIEIIEVVCGTAIVSALVLIRVVVDLVRMFPKQETKEQDQDNRRYSQPPPPEKILSSKDKLNSRKILLLNATVSISYIVLVIPQRLVDFVLFLQGSSQTINTIGTKNISLLSNNNWRILLSHFLITPLIHGILVFLAFTFARNCITKPFRRRTSQPFKRRMPIRQHTNPNFCESVDISEIESGNDNSEVDNGSTKR